MKRYRVVYTKHAELDIDELRGYISTICFAPLTAQRYAAGIIRKIKWLETHAELRPIDENTSRRLGITVRRINYKKMAVIYWIDKDEVFIYRIIPQSLL